MTMSRRTPDGGGSGTVHGVRGPPRPKNVAPVVGREGVLAGRIEPACAPWPAADTGARPGAQVILQVQQPSVAKSADLERLGRRRGKTT